MALDTSTTPPGKLAKYRFSLRIKNSKNIDDITVPVSQEELTDATLIFRLQKLTPEEVREDI